jgi:hypothetical protein
MGASCVSISDSFTWQDCISGMGQMYQGSQYDCGTFSPCVSIENMCIGDPVLTFQTSLPIPSLPNVLTFVLVDSVPHTSWYALPPSLGGETLFVSDFSGQFTVAALQSSHPDTVNLYITNYTFDAPSVLINGIPTGMNTISLDSTNSTVRHGNFHRISKQVNLVIPTILANDIFSSSNPVRSQSQIIGSFDEATGVLTCGSESISILPPCCEGNRGDVNGDGSNANIIDLTFLVDRIFRGGPPASCPEEADVNGDGASANILDLTFLVDYIFRGSTAPPSCP